MFRASNFWEAYSVSIYLRPANEASTFCFRPPSVERLSEVDPARCEYNGDVVEIEGVVGPKGQGGSPQSEDYSIHIFCFSAWRRLGQEVKRNELVIIRPVPEEGDWFSEFPKLSLQRIKVILATNETRAVFAGTSNAQPDSSKLSEIAAELAKPLIIQTEKFGELRLDRSIGWFDGKSEWNGKSVQLSFDVEDSNDIGTALEVAEQLWADEVGWKTKVEAYAIQELLALKNECWLENDEATFTPDQFLERMTLNSITVFPDGRFDFWHDDGDLFGGHAIQISGSLNKGLTHADIPG
jgi:hypothetical protein